MTTWAYQYFELSSLGSSFCQEVQILLYIWQKWFFCIYDRNYIWQQLTEQKRNQGAYPWRKKKDSKLRPWEMSQGFISAVPHFLHTHRCPYPYTSIPSRRNPTHSHERHHQWLKLEKIKLQQAFSTIT